MATKLPGLGWTEGVESNGKDGVAIRALERDRSKNVFVNSAREAARGSGNGDGPLGVDRDQRPSNTTIMAVCVIGGQTVVNRYRLVARAAGT